MAVQSKERLNELLEKYELTGDMNVRNEIDADVYGSCQRNDSGINA